MLQTSPVVPLSELTDIKHQRRPDAKILKGRVGLRSHGLQTRLNKSVDIGPVFADNRDLLERKHLCDFFFFFLEI